MATKQRALVFSELDVILDSLILLREKLMKYRDNIPANEFEALGMNTRYEQLNELYDDLYEWWEKEGGFNE